MLRSLATVVLAVLAALPHASAQTDAAGSQDYPGISRMPGYYISNYQDTPFDTHTFAVLAGHAKQDKPVEGRKIEFRYDLKDGAAMPSELQIVRNYQNAAKAAGGEVLFDSAELTTLRLAKAAREAWIELRTSNRPSGMFFTMVLIEKQPMQQDVTINASTMAEGLRDTGRIALYGIAFDTGKSDIKPESEPALAEIAKLLQANAALRLYIVGHTDITADLALNMKLSQARAQSVVIALTAKHGIAAARLSPFGAGPYAPVASNATEEGRAKNRRVELVEIPAR
ncbi:MAG: OmpA family protein [Candidatus Solibacter sp.]